MRLSLHLKLKPIHIHLTLIRVKLRALVMSLLLNLILILINLVIIILPLRKLLIRMFISCLNLIPFLQIIVHLCVIISKSFEITQFYDWGRIVRDCSLILASLTCYSGTWWSSLLFRLSWLSANFGSLRDVELIYWSRSPLYRASISICAIWIVMCALNISFSSWAFSHTSICDIRRTLWSRLSNRLSINA